jgi:DNA repair exonuclease SbcCD ATPase subunit
MTINNTVPFMAQSKIDKRKFIESVLNLEAFSDMLSDVRDEYNDIKKDYEVLFAKNQTVEKSFKVSKEQLDLFEENKKTKIERIKNKIIDNNSKIDSLSKEKVELPDNVDELLNNKATLLNDELKSIRNDYKNAFTDVTVVKTNITNLQKELKNMDQVEASCRTCKRPFPEDDINHKKQHIEDINKEINILKESETKALTVANNISDLETNKENEINEINNKKTKINNIKSANSNIQSRVLFLKDNNDELLEEQQKVLDETNSNLEQTVKDFELEFISNKNQIEKLDKDLSVLECVKFVVSEEGVKSYIVKKILKVLNSRLAHYLEALQANCLCQFNEYFDETITDEKNIEKSYFNFSGGERKRIDLACLFAFLDIRRMQGDVHFSTIFYDELLDSSLDDKGVELVLKVLRERTEKYNENCYIITHRGTAITAKVDNIIFLEKRNSFTYIL